MKNILTITWLTFEEARRRFVAIAALGLGIAFILLYGVGLNLINSNLRRQNVSEIQLEFNLTVILLAGLYVVHFLTIMLTIFASVDSVSGEITSHTIQAIVTKPVQRWQVLAGKWLGLVVMLILYVALLCSGLVGVTAFLVGYLPPNLLEGSLIMILEIPVLLSLSMLCGTILTTLTNGVALFMFYGLAFIGSWVEQVGSALQVNEAVQVGIVTSLFLPVEALWRRAAFQMQPAILQNLPTTPFSASSAPSPVTLIYAGVYCVVLLGLAMRLFSRRDL